MITKNAPDGRHAWVATVGPKGQIVLSKKAREMFGIQPGDSLLVLADAKRGICIPNKKKTDKLLSSVFSDLAGDVAEDDEPEEGGVDR